MQNHLTSLMLKIRRACKCGCNDIYFNITLRVYVQTMYTPQLGAVRFLVLLLCRTCVGCAGWNPTWANTPRYLGYSACLLWLRLKKKNFEVFSKKEQRSSIRISTNSQTDFSGRNAYQNSHWYAFSTTSIQLKAVKSKEESPWGCSSN